MQFNYEKNRILLTRIAAALFLFLFFTGGSYWETKSEFLAALLFFTGAILVAIASLGRMWCSLYIAGYKDDRLVKTGPYSLCRNPLYFFSMIGAVGVGCATETLTFPILLLVIFASYYGFVIRSEEARLREQFGVEFEEYVKTVPSFFPRLTTFVEPESYMVKPIVFRNHMFSALWFIWAIGILEVFEAIKEIGILAPLWRLY